MNEYDRNLLWKQTFDSYYDCFFEEMVAEKLGGRWLLINKASRIIVALTASGSAISGLALWQDQRFKGIWILMTIVSALASILNASIGFQEKEKEYEELRRGFTSLRLEYETLRNCLAVNNNLETGGFQLKFEDKREKFSKLMAKLSGDIFRRESLERKMQGKLNSRLASEIN